jgi:hypothetical protein
MQQYTNNFVTSRRIYPTQVNWPMYFGLEVSCRVIELLCNQTNRKPFYLYYLLWCTVFVWNATWNVYNVYIVAKAIKAHKIGLKILTIFVYCISVVLKTVQVQHKIVRGRPFNFWEGGGGGGGGGVIYCWQGIFFWDRCARFFFLSHHHVRFFLPLSFAAFFF